jgi:hypothetical protein
MFMKFSIFGRGEMDPELRACSCAAQGELVDEGSMASTHRSC